MSLKVKPINNHNSPPKKYRDILGGELWEKSSHWQQSTRVLCWY